MNVNNGDWVVRKLVAGRWSHPGVVTCVLEDMVIYQVLTLDGDRVAVHAPAKELRLANKADFDRMILDANQNILKTERVISELYQVQREVFE